MQSSNKRLVKFSNNTENNAVILILLFAFFLRILFLVFYPEQHFPDAIAYRHIGEQIFSGDTISNNIYMPLYPIITYLTGGDVFQIIFDVFISVVSIWIIYLLSLHLFKDRFSAILSSIIAALYPHYIFYSISGLTEVFFTFLLLLYFLMFYKKRYILAIIISILAILVKPTFDLLNPVLIILFVGFVHSSGWRKVIKYLSIYTLAYIVIMAPWWIHQHDKYGSFVRLSLGDGVVLYSGNNPLNKTGGGIGRPSGDSDMDLEQFSYIQDPVIRNNEMKKQALDYIVNNPRRFLELAGIKFLRLWRLWPHTEHYQQWYIVATSLLSYGSVLFLSIGFVVTHSKNYIRNLIPLFALITYLTLIHMITIGSIRYRFPLEPFLIIFAGYFLTSIFKNKSWFIKFEDKIFGKH
jgi:hypothetical protein